VGGGGGGERYAGGAIFTAGARAAAAAVIWGARAVPASKDPDAAAVDMPGLVLSSAMMTLLVFTIIEAPAYGWTAGRSVAGFAGSAVLLAAFIPAQPPPPPPLPALPPFPNPPLHP